MEDTYFTKNHEWIRMDESDSSYGTVGITHYAQKQLGDIVFVDLPDPGMATKGKAIAVVESVKAASDIYVPVSGEILLTNETLKNRPERINSNPMDKGWIFTMKISDRNDLKSLMDKAEYKAYIANL